MVGTGKSLVYQPRTKSLKADVVPGFTVITSTLINKLKFELNDMQRLVGWEPG
jgi:hypothetical protein